MKKYKFKLEDKAAFLNLLDKSNITISSRNMIDNTVGDNNYFEVIIDDPIAIKKIDTMLHSDTKIHQLKEIIRRIIREELSK
jgi:predicted RNA methylase